MRMLSAAILLATLTTPAFADDAALAHRGDMLRDVNNVRIGVVDSVKPDGSIGIIVNSRYVIVPVGTISLVEGRLVTKLTKKDVSALN